MYNIYCLIPLKGSEKQKTPELDQFQEHIKRTMQETLSRKMYNARKMDSRLSWTKNYCCYQIEMETVRAMWKTHLHYPPAKTQWVIESSDLSMAEGEITDVVNVPRQRQSPSSLSTT